MDNRPFSISAWESRGDALTAVREPDGSWNTFHAESCSVWIISAENLSRVLQDYDTGEVRAGDTFLEWGTPEERAAALAVAFQPVS